ncbi:S46 family peptidase [Altererythrobacter sp. MF3-039]|uniref:S46 family peptidase n=1 Tax=Altererythrobacter sp. MF3-039 TaxID=3252901 RepID=UPI00390CBEF3
MKLRSALIAGVSLVSASFAATSAQADEGMWTFDAFPTERMTKDYGWAPDQVWLDKVQAAAVRLTGGCSASFVSPDGLILTNHHCISTCLFDNSTSENDLLEKGFIAASRADEKECPGQQAEVVTSISDVTSDVKASFAGMTGEALTMARNAKIAEIESANCNDLATERCQVVSLYGGGEYKLYKYRKYSDVRIAWAPEDRARKFGGDPDNFNFPRYSMDASFLRAYENGKPVSTPSHLEWNPRAPEEGEITFVVGNPGSTSRLYTQSRLAFNREVQVPILLATVSEFRGRLINEMSQSAEKTREGKDTLDQIENSLKVFIGWSRALNDAGFMGRLAAQEADLRAQVAGNAEIGDPWSDIDAAVAGLRNVYLSNRYDTPSGDLFGYANSLVTAAIEREKPNAERLPGYTNSALPLLEKNITDAKPIYPWLEEMWLEWSLSKAREYLGVGDPQSQLLLGKESPEALAERLVTETKLADPEVRKALWEGGMEAIEASDDPLIQYALRLEPLQRQNQKWIDENYSAPLSIANGKLADARFAAYGDSVYPDATFTLRISYGQVKGWEERGQDVPYRTLMGGTYDRATGYEPFDLPSAFAAHKGHFDADATYNFVSTNDIIGGNSGSPVIDRDGTVIGTAFDGNIHSIGGNYGYDGTMNRSVSVSTEAIQVALETLYPAPNLVKELQGG